MKDKTYFIVMSALAAAFFLSTVNMCQAAEFYFRVGAGIHDEQRDSYNTHSPKMGHVSIGIKWDSDLFVEYSHDSDLQAHDVGYDRIYFGVEKRWNL